MYSIKSEYTTVRRRLDEIEQWALPSERFVFSVFLMEKLLRRTLVQLVVSAGFTTEEAFRIVKEMSGVERVGQNWRRYDPHGRTLVAVIGNATWQIVQQSATRRNELVHGSDHRSELSYKRQMRRLLQALDGIKDSLDATYGYSGWRGMQTRDATALHRDPKVRV